MNPRVEELVYWMVERELMRMRKEAGGPPPYSRDPIMAHTRFTNVRREDDKVTRWLEANGWRTNTPDLPQRLTLARMVNYIPTLEELSVPGADPLEVLCERAERGEKVWSSAYTITTCGKQLAKEEYVVWHVCAGVAALGPLPRAVATLDSAHKWLMHVDGLGSFLAAQIVADMKNTKGHQLQHASDWYSWSAPGPGSLKGLSEFWGKSVTPSGYKDAIMRAWTLARPLLPQELQHLSMQDFQNVMCEVSKYFRVKAGGKARNKYGQSS
jgi:alpha-glutamyl/putrescinyl thymine pyrophosphorylase clade 1